MEIKIARRRQKGQLMTLTVLLLFILMFSILLIYSTINVNYNNVAQSLALSSGTTNYGALLAPEAAAFAKASMQNALGALFVYEYNASLRKGNLVANYTGDLSSLITNGMLPGVAANTPAANSLKSMMNNLTFVSYNAALLAVLNTSYRSVLVNETAPVISQAGPYNLSLSYIENVEINSSGSAFTFSVPVNVSVSLNGTPDLYYAQQGVVRYIEPGALTPAKTIGGYATYGNTIGMIYGTVYAVPSGVTCTTLSSAIPAALNVAPVNKTLILATANAVDITGGGGCYAANKYGGLITYMISSREAPPNAIPYLVFNQLAPGNIPILNYIMSGQQLLLYGPELSVMNITGVINDVSSQDYYGSPLAPSYISRTEQNFSGQSPYGLFTFQGTGIEAAESNGSLAHTSWNQYKGSNLTGTSNAFCTATLGSPGLSTSIWFKMKNTTDKWDSDPASPNFTVLYSCGGGWELDYHGGKSFTWASNKNVYFTTESGTKVAASPGAFTFNVPSNILNNTWYNIAITYNGVNTTAYLDGSLVASNAITSSSAGTTYPLVLAADAGADADGYYNGLLANFQVYNTSLSGAQVAQIYRDGISGLPIAGAGLYGWWPLNGNGNDLSGQGDSLIAHNISWQAASNYTRDSALITTVPGPYVSIPGVDGCVSNRACNNTLEAQLYLGQAPIEVGNSQQAGRFNTNSIVTIPNNAALQASTMTVTAWVNVAGPPAGSIYNWVYNKDNAWDIGLCGSSDYLCYDNYGGAGEAESATELSDGTWYFVSATVSAGTETLYLNGADVYSNSVVISSQTLQPAIGGSVSSAVSGFNGTIADVQLYNASLPQATLQALYSEGINGAPASLQNLVGWWPLDGDARDYSSLGDNGIAYNLSYVGIGTGNYLAPGLSTLTGEVKELQALGYSTVT